MPAGQAPERPHTGGAGTGAASARSFAAEPPGPAPGTAMGVPAARQASHSPGPAPSAPEFPSAPSGGASIAPGGLIFAGFLALFGAVALLLVGPTRRLRLAPAALGPAPFISLLERPG